MFDFICAAWIEKEELMFIGVWMKHWILFYFFVLYYSLPIIFSLSTSSSLTLRLFCLPECVNAFALVVRPPTEQENLLFSFQLAGEDTVKSDWLRTLCRHVANTICRADAVSQCTLARIKEPTWYDRSAGGEGSRGHCVSSSWHKVNCVIPVSSPSLASGEQDVKLPIRWSTRVLILRMVVFSSSTSCLSCFLQLKQ